MKIKDILEARKNPEQNPKTSVNDVIYDELLKMKGDKSGYSTIGGVTNLFVSFTAIPKLGINPGSTYNTPNGIYAYPAEYVVKQVGTDDPMNMLPFAGDQPWVNLFTVANDVINVRTLNKTDYKMYVNDLEKEFVKSGAIPSNEFKTMTNDVINVRTLNKTDYKMYINNLEKEFVETGVMPSNEFKNIVDNADTDAARADYWGGQLWYVTMKIAEYWAKTTGGQRNNKWNAVWRLIGIVGAVDTGAGIIHEGEPTQAVFFDLSKIEVITREANKYSPETMRVRQRLGLRQADKKSRQLRELRTFLQTKPSVADLMDWLNQTADRWDLFPRLPKEYRHRMLSKFSHYLTFYPSGKIPREDYLAALTNNPLQTLDVYDPSDKIQKWHDFVNQQQLATILENWRLKNPNFGTDNYTRIWTLLRSIVNPNSFRIDKTFKMHPDLAKVLLKFNPEIIIEVIGMNNSPEIIEFARQVAEEQNNFSALRFINNIKQ